MLIARVIVLFVLLAAFSVLGAWDFDIEQGIISYLSPVAQALVGRKVGDEVEFEFHGALHRYRVELIELYRAAGEVPGAVPSAAVLAGRVPSDGPIVALVTGGNVDTDVYERLTVALSS